ncbi:MAG TPA: hypothetical protein VFI02_00905, partial [Armatimonadota bacterium]|nr:hypothetical protein [Armatimonadota bacterium]
MALVSVLACAGSVLAFDTPDWMIRVGTVPHAITLADDSHVCLDAVEIEKIRAKESPAYFVIKDWFDPSSRLLVMTLPSPELRMGQTVDIEGTISTLADGRKAIIDPTVLGYTDKDGKLLLSGPRMKGFDEPFPWEWKIDLTVSGEFLMSGTPREELLDSLSEELCETIADAKAVSDGTAVELRSKPIASIDSGFFIMGEDGSSDTLKVYYTGTVSVADRIRTITGTVQTEDSERVLDVDSGPEYDPQIFVGSIQTATDGTIEWVKTWPDGHVFGSGDITAKIITRDWTDYFYVEQDDRSCGIRVEKTAHGRHRDDKVDIEGTLGTNADLERYIAAATITLNGSGTLKPLFMIQRSLGGGDFAYLPGPPASGQRGTKDAHGVNNIGLLLTGLGRVTAIDTGSPPQWFRIDDGSVVEPKIAYPPYGISVDDYVIISGISSCEYDDVNDWLLPALRPQPLTVTINQASGQGDPTNATPINFTVVFSEPVTDFDDADDIEITGDAGGTKTVAITPVGSEGKEYNVAISGMTDGTVVASIPCGKALGQSGVWNYASTSTDNSVLFDGSAPSTPSEPFLDSIIVTSNKLHASWTAATDSGSGIKRYTYKIVYKDTGGTTHDPTWWYTTTETEVFITQSVTYNYQYQLHILAEDNAGNLSAEVVGDWITCQKTKIGFLYHNCHTGAAGTYDDTRWFVDRYLYKVRLGSDCYGKVTYVKITAAPTTDHDFDSYNVLFVALPEPDFTSTEIDAIQSFVNQGFNKRLVLVGEYGRYPTGIDTYLDGYSAYNNRLNGLASSLDETTRFHSDESTQTAYNSGIALDYTNHYVDCPVRSHYLTNGVGGLWDAATSAFTTYVHPIAAMREGESAYPGKFWVVEEDIPQGCS